MDQSSAPALLADPKVVRLTGAVDLASAPDVLTRLRRAADHGSHDAYFSFREFWVLCRATGHQTFSIWGTLSGCALVAIHYWSMRISTVPGTVQSIQLATNMTMGAMAVAILGTFILTAHRHKFEASLGGVAATSLGLLYIYFLQG